MQQRDESPDLNDGTVTISMSSAVRIEPAMWENVSQMLGPFPPSPAAPSSCKNNQKLLRVGKQTSRRLQDTMNESRGRD